MQRVAIINYGSGNLHSAAKAFERASRESEADAKIEVTSDPKIVAAADRIVLPGVGAFADCKRGLEKVSGMREAMERAVHGQGKPFLGICVGMQLLATRGLEFETTEGLNWIAGEVRAIEPKDPNLKIPHMGWNTLQILHDHTLLRGIATGAQGLHAYFVHSFHLVATDKSSVLAETDYAGPITAIVTKENVAGTQFHPEKSQTLGLKFLANFLNWRP